MLLVQSLVIVLKIIYFLTRYFQSLKKIATDKEFCVFYLIAEGKTFEEVGYTFNVTASRVRQIFDGVFNKLLIVA
jgi:DNA-binding NarL/FixJ family response regulator